MSKIKASDIDSGTAPSGQVPIANGSGGVAWGAQSGGGGGGGAAASPVWAWSGFGKTNGKVPVFSQANMNGDPNSCAGPSWGGHSFYCSSGFNNQRINVDFGEPVDINGWGIYQENNSVSQGVWQGYWSDDGTTYHSIGSPSELGLGYFSGVTWENTTGAHRYWRIQMVSGTGNGGPWWTWLYFLWNFKEGTPPGQWDFDPPKVADFPITFGVPLLVLADDTDAGLQMQAAASHGTAMGIAKAVPASTAFSAIMKFNSVMMAISGAAANIGIALGESTHSHFYWTGFDSRSAFHTMLYGTSGYEGYEKLITASAVQGPHWARVDYDPTTGHAKSYFSGDGKVWFLFDEYDYKGHFGADPATIGFNLGTESYAYNLAASITYYHDNL